MARESLASCRALSKTYVTPSGAIEALRSVDLELEAGKVTAIIDSGSGKSTLLRALTTGSTARPKANSSSAAATCAPPPAASSGATGAPEPPTSRRKRRITSCRTSRCASTPRISPAESFRLLDEFGVGHRLDARPIELSGGEQARAAFALALARRTPLVVVDEPTAELDRPTAALLLDAMRRHTAAGMAFAVATHDPDVTSGADQVVRLERGRVVPGVLPSPPPAIGGRLPLEERETLAAHSLRKSFRRGGETVIAARDADLALRPGEVGVLLGRSGSGKSTLLTLLAGWQRPDAGEITWAGQPVDPAGLAWAQLAYLPQRFGLLPELSVRENVEYPARLAGSLGDLRERVDELLAALGLDELAARPPTETSIGQQQRTTLARALVLQPPVLLADEPSSHQDASFRDRVWQQIGEAAAAGTACLIATHEDEAAGYATRLWRITDGKALQA